jgi:hypothetical protein
MAIFGRLISRGIALCGAAIGAACLIASPASAQTSVQRVDGADGWIIASYGNGCSVVLFDYHLTSTFVGLSRTDYRIAIEGGCDAGGRANGPLTITQDWNVISDFDGQQYSYHFVATANAVGGLLQGHSEEGDYERDPATGQWVFSDRGDVRNPMPTYFRNGCPYFVDNGVPDFSPEYNDWQGCNENGATVSLAKLSPRGTTPARAPATARSTPAATAPTTFTTVGGAPVGPAPSFAAGQENALATVAEGLVAVLGGRDGLGFANGEASIETIIASLRTTLGLNGSAALDGKAELLSFVLGEVRKALAGANPASTDGQVADLVMGTVRQAIDTANRPAPAPMAAQAGGRLVSAADVESVVEYLRGKGGQFTRQVTTAGDPALQGNDGRYDVFFLGCVNNAQCVTVQFRACDSSYPNASLAKANGWNRQYSYAKSYLDQDGNVCVELTVPTGRGGISPEALDVAFDAFIWLRDNMGTQFN